MSTPVGVDVAALDAVPGTEDLTRAARTLARLDLPAVDDMVADLAAAADGLVTTPSAVRPAPGAGWSGPGADAYTGWADGVARAAGGTEQASRAAAAELGRLVAVLRGAAREVDDHVALAADAAFRVRGAAGPADPDPESLRAVVAGPAAAARAVLARAEQELADATARLRDHTDALAGFSRVPAPDTTEIARPAGPEPLRPAPVRPATTRPDTPVMSGPGAGLVDGSLDRVVAEPDDAAGSGGDGGPGGAADVPVRPADDLAAPLVPAPAPAPLPAGVAPGARDPVTPPAPAPTPAPVAGGVAAWVRAARETLVAAGVPGELMDPDAIATIIDHESGGDPDAVNGGDANAARGTPSQGLMQTIGPTFDAYRLPGHDDIRDPVDNIIAGVRYAIDRYGSVSRVPGVVALAEGRAYVGY